MARAHPRTMPRLRNRPFSSPIWPRWSFSTRSGAFRQHCVLKYPFDMENNIKLRILKASVLIKNRSCRPSQTVIKTVMKMNNMRKSDSYIIFKFDICIFPPKNRPIVSVILKIKIAVSVYHVNSESPKPAIICRCVSKNAPGYSAKVTRYMRVKENNIDFALSILWLNSGFVLSDFWKLSSMSP